MLLTAGLALSSPSHAAIQTSLIPVTEVGRDYVRPHDLVDVGHGRKMNLYCRGQGAVTVVFDSGLSDWSYVWALVQPAVASRTRACAYDRAGIGYSDPSPRPSSPVNIVDDLHTLLKAAGVEGPLILVGHSLGGFNMKLYALTYPSQVAGLVLVDSSQERTDARIGALERARFGKDLVDRFRAQMAAGFKTYLGHLTHCAETLPANTGDKMSDWYKSCVNVGNSGPIVPLGQDINAEFEVIQARPTFQKAQASEVLNSVYGPAAQPNTHYSKLFGGKHPFGDKPLIVLTHGIYDMAEPYGELRYFESTGLDRQTAVLSTRGVQRMVPSTRHYIQIDNPQAVVDAVDQILETLGSASGKGD